jgi:hypothetical protein
MPHLIVSVEELGDVAARHEGDAFDQFGVR